jgi:DNA-binding response OmpR family regulator
MKILLIEDDRTLGSTLVDILEPHYQIDWVTSLKDATTYTSLAPYQGIVADLRLPDGNSMELCQRLRKQNNSVPFLIVTGNPEECSTSESLFKGADDYMMKPFKMNEFLARLHAILRRSTHYTPDIVAAGNIEIDRVHHVISIQGKEIALRRKEFDILLLLALHVNKSLTTTRIIEILWGANSEPFSNSVEVHICRLRQTLQKAQAKPTIVTIKNFGYSLHLPNLEKDATPSPE